MNTLLDNIVWHTLCGPHAAYTEGTDRARRYVPGFSPFIAFADLEHPDFDALAPYAAPGEQLYCDGWAGLAAAGWRVASETILVKMTWEGGMPAANQAPEAVLLGPLHADAALGLAKLTVPGPFAARSIELGEYFGVFDGARLIAMAGGRLCAGGYREISGVCTHPDFQGRGLARRLVLKLLRRQMRRGEKPFLRVMRENQAVHGLYQRMGFCDYRDSVARVVARYFQVATDDQAETDRLWDAIISNGGQESACGWCKDKWGLSWQITPRTLTAAIADPDRAVAKRAFDAMMQMRKIDIAAIDAARGG